MYGSSSGSSPYDPPFAQLSDSSRSWKDRAGIFASGAFNSLAPDYMKSAVGGAGDYAAYLKRKRSGGMGQQQGMMGRRRQSTRDRANQLLNEYAGE